MLKDEYVSTKDFYNTGVRISYTKELSGLGFSVESNIGVKNLFNAYQNDFDVFENRDITLSTDLQNHEFFI